MCRRGNGEQRLCRPVTTVAKAANGEEIEETFYASKTYTVFCIDQVWGNHLDHLRVGHATLNAKEVEQRYEHADEVFDAIDATIKYGGNSAHYDFCRDQIVLPHRHQFAPLDFYNTAFHELVHWTEHPSRLIWIESSRATPTTFVNWWRNSAVAS